MKKLLGVILFVLAIFVFSYNHVHFRDIDNAGVHSFIYNGNTQKSVQKSVRQTAPPSPVIRDKKSTLTMTATA